MANFGDPARREKGFREKHRVFPYRRTRTSTRKEREQRLRCISGSALGGNHQGFLLRSFWRSKTYQVVCEVVAAEPKATLAGEPTNAITHWSQRVIFDRFESWRLSRLPHIFFFVFLRPKVYNLSVSFGRCQGDGAGIKRRSYGVSGRRWRVRRKAERDAQSGLRGLQEGM